MRLGLTYISSNGADTLPCQNIRYRYLEGNNTRPSMQGIESCLKTVSGIVLKPYHFTARQPRGSFLHFTQDSKTNLRAMLSLH